MTLRSLLIGSSLTILAAGGGQAQPVPAHDGPLPFKTEVAADFGQLPAAQQRTQRRVQRVRHIGVPHQLAVAQAAEPWGIPHEKPVVLKGRVIEALCHLKGVCASDCGAGKRQRKVALCDRRQLRPTIARMLARPSGLVASTTPSGAITAASEPSTSVEPSHFARCP